MTILEAAETWRRNVREIRATTDARQDAVYSRWLRTGMLCTERDRLMQGLRAGEDAAIAMETRVYYANRALAGG